MTKVILAFNIFLYLCVAANDIEEMDCSKLRLGQYLCPDPSYDLIDPKTQQPYGCTQENKARGTLVYYFNSFCFIFYKR